MKRLIKAITTATLPAILLVSVASTSIVAAAGTGQIEGGPGLYQVKNLTEGGAYGSTISAKACEELQYSIRLHNSGFTAVNNIHAQATLPASASTSNTSALTVTYTDGVVPSTSGSVTVTFPAAQSISYEAGTTTLFDGNGNVVKTLPDGITGSGIGLGSLDGSTTEYVNFKAQTNCPTPPPPAFTCDELNITTGDNRTVKISTFNVTAKNGATFKNADISWGDGSSKNGANPVVGLTHQYGQDGTFTIAGTAHFDVNGQDKTATSAACAKQVTFKSGTSNVTPVTTTSSPSAPTTLVNTGPGSVAAWAAGIAVVLGTVAYRWRLVSRRLSRSHNR